MASGLEVGDRIVEIDGEQVRSFNDLVEIVEPRPGMPVVIEFVRDGRTRNADVVLGEQVRDGKTLGLLGVSVSNDYGDFFFMRKFGPVELSRGSQQSPT